MLHQRGTIAVALAALVLGGCSATVQVHPKAPMRPAMAPRIPQAVGLLEEVDFATRVQVVTQGPVTMSFELGRGGAPMVREILQQRFRKVVPVTSRTLAAGQHPDVHAILVPRWQDFTSTTLDPEGTTRVTVVLGLELIGRDGKQVSTRTYRGQYTGVVSEATGGLAALTEVANHALEAMGASMSRDLGSPAMAEELARLEAADAAREADQARKDNRKHAKPLYVRDFVGRGPDRGLAKEFQAKVLASLLATGRFVAVVAGEDAKAVDEAVEATNRETTSEEEWIRIGKGRGAELMLKGEVATSPDRCSVKVEMVDLTSRVVLGSYFKSMKPCTREQVLALDPEVVRAMTEAL